MTDNTTTTIGYRGENLAKAYLEAKGMQFVLSNYRSGRGEIDLVFKENKTLVFVEVKYRTGTGYGYPEAQIGQKKIDILKKTAEMYLYDSGWNADIRFDVVSIVKVNKQEQVTHFEDVFY